jgi:hypothetical protein
MSPSITDLPASTTSTNSRVDGSSLATAVDSASPVIDIDTTSPTIDIDTASPVIDIDTMSPAIDIDTTSPAIDIDIDTASPAIDIDAASPTIINITSSADIDTASPTIGTLYSPTIIEFAPMFAIDPQVTTIVDRISCLTGSTSARIGGFDMTFGLFNFHMDDDGAAELISIIEPAPLIADPNTPLAVGSTPSIATPLTTAEEDPRLETSTPSVGSNDFQDPPPSPTTA